MRYEYVLANKPKTLGGQRGFDMLREIGDNLDKCRAKKIPVDLIVISGGVNDYLQKAWLEMAPENTPMPQNLGGIKTIALATPGNTYAFLREYFPYEKRRAMFAGDNLYDKKAVVATGEF
jgi:hypothetical protein